MFGAKQQSIRPYWIHITVVAIGVQHKVGLLRRIPAPEKLDQLAACAARRLRSCMIDLIVGYLCGASGSMPRSILAIRSWCLRTMLVIAIAPPTMTATIGIRNGPNLRISPMRHLLLACLF